MTQTQLERPDVQADGAGGGEPPVLWHLKVSNYNEKARWALDYKRVPHVRRAAVPGRHQAIARRLSGGNTFPILILDGEPIGDSTAIIAALERLRPQPPLYPSDPRARRRTLELEDFFDEQLGPYVRMLAVAHTLEDPDLLLSMFVPDISRGRRLVARATFPLLRRRLIAQFGIDDQAIDDAYEKVRAAGERFRSELRPNGYLDEAGFGVADLTLASLVAPMVAPEQFPYPQAQRGHPLLEPLRAALSEGGILEWTHQMYRRHRGSSAEIAVATEAGSGAWRTPLTS